MAVADQSALLDRLSPRGEKVIALANEEARVTGPSEEVSGAYLLVALIREREQAGLPALESLDRPVDRIRVVGRAQSAPAPDRRGFLGPGAREALVIAETV